MFVTIYCAGKIATETVFDVEPAKPVSPLYVATMEYVPVGKVVLVRTAMPVVFTGTVPSTVEPVLKVTVPVGAGVVRVEAIVAVRVTLVLGGTGVAAAIEEVRVVVVDAGVTTMLSADPVLLANVSSPL